MIGELPCPRPNRKSAKQSHLRSIDREFGGDEASCSEPGAGTPRRLFNFEIAREILDANPSAQVDRDAGPRVHRREFGFSIGDGGLEQVSFQVPTELLGGQNLTFRVTRAGGSDDAVVGVGMFLPGVFEVTLGSACSSIKTAVW